MGWLRRLNKALEDIETGENPRPALKVIYFTVASLTLIAFIGVMIALVMLADALMKGGV